MNDHQRFQNGGRFELRGEIGAGGMGTVYEAFDHERNELVALKALENVDARALARFKREFRALHDLSHPNLVALGEFFEGDAGPFFSMELVRGVHFLDYVRGETAPRARAPAPASQRTTSNLKANAPSGEVGPTDPTRPGDGFPRPATPVPFDEVRLRDALRQLAVAIAVVHRIGMVHRDIKPSNVLVTSAGRVVLLDFGLATEAGAIKDARHSSHTDLVGTVAYMAPEQAMSGDVTPAADWYSVGVLLFEALTGSLPHTGRTGFELILNKQKHRAAPPRQFVPDTPKDLDALCTGLLEAEVADRLCGSDVFDRLGITDDQPLPSGLDSRSSMSAASTFVGRTNELAALRSAYERSRTGALICLVEGVSGIGKTQLIDVFIEQLCETERDLVVLTGRCYEREVVAYKAFDGIVDVLARYLAHLPPVETARVLPLRPALLRRLFPAFRRVEAIAAAQRAEDIPDPHLQRRRLFASLRELFLRLTAERRVICFIDDLQWTDADSLILLQELLAGDEPLPLLLVATIRPIDEAERRNLFSALESAAPVETLALGELPPDDARSLAGLLLSEKSADSLEAVAADAGGHPLLLHELARYLDRGARSTAAGMTLEQMLDERIGQLPSPARLLLDLVALYGGPVTQEVVAVAARLSHGEQVKLARMLRAAYLIRTDGVGRSDRIVTYHDRVREHVVNSLDEDLRTRLHERLALALEQTGAAQHEPRALVRHARAAGRHTLAATHARAAARSASSALAFDQAADFMRIALDLGSYEPEAERGLRIELAMALMQAGRGPEAAEAFMHAADGAEPATRLECRRHAADQWMITGHLDKGLEVLRGSLSELGEPFAASPRSALARVLWNRLRLRVRGLRFQLKRETQIPIETLRRLDALKAAAHGLAMIDNIRGADFNGRYLLLALRAGEAERLVDALGAEVVFLASQGGGAARRSRRAFRLLRELAESSPNKLHARAWVLLADGAASFFEGRFDAAIQSLEEIETVFVEAPPSMLYERNNARVFRVHTLRMLGALRRQYELIVELMRTERQRGDRYLETTLMLLHGHSQLARGDVEGARASVSGATWTPPGKGFHLQHWYELRSRVELAIYEQTASTAIDELSPQFAALDRSMLLRVKLVRADAVTLRARLQVAAALERGSWDEHAGAVRAAARRATAEKVGYARVYALLLEAALPSTTPDERVDLLRETVSEADAHHMRLHAAAARDRLGRLLGGDEGDQLRALSSQYAADEGVVDPDHMFELVATGL